MHSLRILLSTVAFACVSLGQSVTLTNDSSWRDYPNYIVGDPFTLTVYGAPNKPVTMDAERVGDTTYHWNLGTTDGSGILPVSDVMGSWNVGEWIETVYVDGVEASPTLEFTVEEAETCYFLPYGTGNFSNMYITDWWYSEYQTDPFPDGQGTPQYETHENTGGPCGAQYAYSSTPYVDAEYDFSDYDYSEGGYKSVEWYIEVNDEGSNRCNIFANPNCQYNYPIYSSGYVQSLFEHRDTGEDIWKTTYYNIQIVWDTF